MLLDIVSGIKGPPKLVPVSGHYRSNGTLVARTGGWLPERENSLRSDRKVEAAFKNPYR